MANRAAVGNHKRARPNAPHCECRQHVSLLPPPLESRYLLLSRQTSYPLAEYPAQPRPKHHGGVVDDLGFADFAVTAAKCDAEPDKLAANGLRFTSVLYTARCGPTAGVRC